MKYLEHIELLNSGLRVLKDGERTQVQVTKLVDLETILIHMRSWNDSGSSYSDTIISDILTSIREAQKYEGITHLTENMKQGLIDGLKELKINMCKEAYMYYSKVDFDPTPEVIKSMREVVAYAL